VIAILDRDDAPLEDAPRVVRGSDLIQVAIEIEGELRIVADVFDDSTDLSCGVTYGGPFSVLPEPVQRLDSGLVGSSSTAVTLEPTRRARRVTLRHACEIQAPTLCDRSTITTVETNVVDVHLEVAVPISETEAFVGGTAPLFVGRVTADGTITPLGVPVVNRVRGLVPFEGGAIGFTPSQIFAIDAGGETRFAIDIPRVVVSLDAGEDGSVRYAAADGRLFALTSTTSTEVIGAPPGIVSVRVESEREIRVIAGSAIHRFDGTSWTRELDTDVFGPDARLFGRDPQIALDDEIFFRSSTDTEWRRVEYPFQTLLGVSADTGRGGIVLVGGETGGVALHDGASWCRLDGGLGRDMRGAAFEPGGRVGFLVTAAVAPGSSPGLVRVELP
jgi:hypothetical protein